MKKKLLRGAVLTFLSFVFMFLPFAVLFFFRRDDWLAEGGTSIVIGVMIGLAYGMLVMKGALKEISRNASVLISMSIVIGVVWFLDGIMDDLFWVLCSLLVGYILFIIMSVIGLRDIELYKTYKNERVRMVARTSAQSDTGIV